MTTYCGLALDWIIDWGVALPLTLCDNSPSRVVRMLGVCWLFLWFLPIAMILLPFMILAMVGELIEETWRGT